MCYGISIICYFVFVNEYSKICAQLFSRLVQSFSEKVSNMRQEASGKGLDYVLGNWLFPVVYLHGNWIALSVAFLKNPVWLSHPLLPRYPPDHILAGPQIYHT